MDRPILAQLRVQTRPAHLALEAQPLLKALVSSQLTEPGYGRLIQAMLAFYQPLESKLIPAAAALLDRHPFPDYRYVPRAPLLADDCRALRIAPPGFIDFPRDLRLDDDACLLGALYVIEGSTQGGRLIAKHLARTLGVSDNAGASFFNLHRWDHSWMAFRRWLSTDLMSHFPDDGRRIIAGADMTFTALRAHLNQWQHPTHGN